ncbi:DUF6485 family protein [Candidatus Caldatribacterium sp. SIUC1]|uniref:DUF6485 family protein n=1 Tax=Candidatus Caldatribacterium sp. SIUC1 TaxID=3418365 RepID=UPI003F6948F7
MPECHLKENLAQCTCTYLSCAKRGKCCECVAYHRAHGEIPGCFFPPDVERTYDRSIRRFIAAYQRA